ncbi:MAG: bifunctional DNA primase/polymerase [Acidobacteria bacterium]|nr:bifunctional DNA primase/polymerase [Acidobacteriota bacterium]
MTNSDRERPIITTLEAAREYRARGWWPIPVKAHDKAPTATGWPNLRLTEQDLPAHFFDCTNVGLLLGEPSCLIDIDLDVHEAAIAARHLLPATGLVHGRPTAPRSHLWFIVQPCPAPQKFMDPDGKATLLEVRSTNQQTLVPPSVHPSGEQLVWEAKGDPARIDGHALMCWVSLTAAAALIARRWPLEGNRHSAALALAGFLLRRMDRITAEAFIRAVTEAAGDEETRDRVKTLITTAQRLDEGFTATGAPTLVTIIGKDIVQQVERWIPSSQSTAIGKTRHEITKWPPPLALQAFYGLAGDIVHAIEPCSESDPAALLIQLLAAFGSAVGHGPRFSVEGGAHTTNIFTILVGATAKGRKGSAWARILEVFKRADPTWASSRIASGLSSGEGLIWSVRDPIEKSEPVKERGRVVDYERRITDHGVQDKRLMVVEAEFASVLRVMARDGNILSATVRQAWDSGDLRLLTKNFPAQATGAHISVVAHVTRDELLRHLDRTEFASGFANRFLFVCSRRSKFLPEGAPGESQALDSSIERLSSALDFARGVNPMERDREARQIWARIYGQLSEGRLGLLGAATSRAEAQVLRLSMIYALLDCSPVIRKEHLLAAVAVWDYSEASARYIFGEALGDPTADEILRALSETPDGLTRTEIHKMFGRHKATAEIDRALGVLAEHGLALARTESTNGRPAERWTKVAGAGRHNGRSSAPIEAPTGEISEITPTDP